MEREQQAALEADKNLGSSGPDNTALGGAFIQR